MEARPSSSRPQQSHRVARLALESGALWPGSLPNRPLCAVLGEEVKPRTNGLLFTASPKHWDAGHAYGSGDGQWSDSTFVLELLLRVSGLSDILVAGRSGDGLAWSGRSDTVDCGVALGGSFLPFLYPIPHGLAHPPGNATFLGGLFYLP
jgi:hypothetical protein